MAENDNPWSKLLKLPVSDNSLVTNSTPRSFSKEIKLIPHGHILAWNLKWDPTTTPVVNLFYTSSKLSDIPNIDTVPNNYMHWSLMQITK